MSMMNLKNGFVIAGLVGLLAGAGCTLKEAEDTGASPAPAAPSMAANGETGALPAGTATPAGGAAAHGSESDHGANDGHNHGPSEIPAMAASGQGTTPPGPASGGSAMGGPAPGGPMSGGPMMGGMAMPNDPLTPTPDLDKAITSAEKGTDKKALAAAYAKRGTFRMTDEKAGARIKYRAALEDYRAALKADPANAEAKENKQRIEAIYTSMGRPIPGA